jgi:hypothetical protein
MGVVLGTTRARVGAALTRHQIPRRRERPARLVAKLSGPNNPQWAGGVYNGEAVGFTGSGYQRQKARKKVIAERGKCCEFCRTTPKRLELHHVIPFRFCLTHDQVVLVCTGCHGKLEKLFVRLSGAFFVSNGCPGLADAVTTLKSQLSTTTS